MINNFNKENFALLLEKARSGRTCNNYSDTIGVSPTYISRLLRRIIDTPPTKEDIRKFVNGSKERTEIQKEELYNKMLEAAGWIEK